MASCIKVAPHTGAVHPMRGGINLVTLFFLRRRCVDGWLTGWELRFEWVGTSPYFESERLHLYTSCQTTLFSFQLDLFTAIATSFFCNMSGDTPASTTGRYSSINRKFSGSMSPATGHSQGNVRFLPFEQKSTSCEGSLGSMGLLALLYSFGVNVWTKNLLLVCSPLARSNNTRNRVLTSKISAPRPINLPSLRRENAASSEWSQSSNTCSTTSVNGGVSASGWGSPSPVSSPYSSPQKLDHADTAAKTGEWQQQQQNEHPQQQPSPVLSKTSSSQEASSPPQQPRAWGSPANTATTTATTATANITSSTTSADFPTAAETISSPPTSTVEGKVIMSFPSSPPPFRSTKLILLPYSWSKQEIW